MSGATPEPPRGQKNTPDPEKSLWHRLERSWPFSRIKKPVDLYLQNNIILAGVPVPGPRDWHDGQVSLEFVKQGTFRGCPATLFSVHVAHWDEKKVGQSCVELRFGPASRRCRFENEVIVAAYGPVDVTRPEFLPTGELISRDQQAQLERVEVYPTKHGLMINSLENALVPYGVHPSFSIVVVIVHTQSALLSAFMTTSDRRRLRVLRRSWVRPLIIDLNCERDPYPSTCGWSTHCGLGERCSEFGPEHMTAEIWRKLGREGVPWMEGDGPEAWVKWPNPLLHGPLPSRSG